MKKNAIDIEALERQARSVERAMQQAVADELAMHKRLGHSIVICEDGQIRDIPAEEIEVDEIP